MSQFGMPAPRNATATLADDPGLSAARIGHRAYAAMNAGEARTADELVVALGVTEDELYAGIQAYLFVTTGYDLSPTTPRTPRATRKLVAA